MPRGAPLLNTKHTEGGCGSKGGEATAAKLRIKSHYNLMSGFLWETAAKEGSRQGEFFRGR